MVPGAILKELAPSEVGFCGCAPEVGLDIRWHLVIGLLGGLLVTLLWNIKDGGYLHGSSSSG